MSPESPKTVKSATARRFSLFPRPLSQSVTQILKPVCKKQGFAEHRILTEWHLVVGAELSACSLPQKLTRARSGREGGTLYVLVAAGRALELQHMQPVILEKIAAYFGYAAVARLHLTQSHSTMFYPPAPKIQPKVCPPDSALLAIASNCEDEDMRAALLSLAVRMSAVEN